MLETIVDQGGLDGSRHAEVADVGDTLGGVGVNNDRLPGTPEEADAR